MLEPRSRAVYVLAVLLASSSVSLATTIPLKTYGASEGLPSSGVKHILRDSRGLLWFSTRGGLARFDGSSFVTYTTAEGLPVPTINAVLDSRKGTLWLATNGRGVCRLVPEAVIDPQTASFCTPYPVGSTPVSNRVNVLFEDGAGRLWAGSDDGLFVSEKPDIGAPFRAVVPGDSQSLGMVHALTGDEKGNVWAGTERGLAEIAPDGSVARLHTTPRWEQTPVHALLWARGGLLWIGSWGKGLVVLKPSASEIEGRRSQERDVCEGSAEIRLPEKAGEYCSLDSRLGLHSKFVHMLFQSADEHLWIGTEDGLAELNGGRLAWLVQEGGLRDVDAVGEDLDGNLWFSCGEGVVKLTRAGFLGYGKSDGLTGQIVVSVQEDGSGRLVVITNDWAIHHFQNGRFSALRPDMPPKWLPWRSQGVFVDSAGEAWLSLPEGLAVLPRETDPLTGNGGQPRRYTDKAGAAPGRVDRVYEDSHHDLWMTPCAESGECRIVRWERSTETFHTVSSLVDIGVHQAASMSEAGGSIWLGFDEEGGLGHIVDGRLVRVSVSEGRSLGSVLSLHRDSRGRLWAGSAEQGLVRIDNPGPEPTRIASYSKAQGLSSNNIRCITSDAWGRIYVGTAVGIDRLDPDTNEVRHYTTLDGLANGLLVTAFRDANGTLWFGTMGGLSKLMPEREPLPNPPPIWIDGVSASGVPQPLALIDQAVGPLSLEPGQNLIRISFSSLHFRMGEAVRYQYKLDTVSPSWSAPTDQRTISFAGLEPGNYVFWVRAMGSNGGVSEKPASVAFTVRPAVWQRASVRLLVAFLCAAVIYFTARYRLAHLLALERIRSRIASDLHDDVGPILTNMALTSRSVATTPGLGEAPTSMLRTIERSASGVLESMADVVWAIQPREDSLTDLVGRMRRFALEATEAAGIDCGFQAELDEALGIPLGFDVRREAYLVFKEALNNAVRHSKASRIDIAVRAVNGELSISVRDNGTGFSEEGLKAGNGLRSMRERSGRIGASFEVGSEPGKGTRILLGIHLAKAPWSRWWSRARRHA